MAAVDNGSFHLPPIERNRRLTSGGLVRTSSRDSLILPSIRGASNSPEHPPSKPSSRRNSHVTRVTLTEPVIRAKGRGFAALGKKVVNVLQWKKKSKEEALEAILEMPAEPRFCATLSLEAQYAMMKGYEDLLIDYLRNTYPERALFLPRSKTPILTEPRGCALVPFPLVNESTALAANFRISSEKRLVITYRFQSAMDILDAVRESQGLLVTSPRYKSKNIKPIEQYGLWNNTWKRDFLTICDERQIRGTT